MEWGLCFLSARDFDNPYDYQEYLDDRDAREEYERSSLMDDDTLEYEDYSE